MKNSFEARKMAAKPKTEHFVIYLGDLSDFGDEDLSTKDGHGKYINDDALDVEEEDQAGQTEAQ